MNSSFSLGKLSAAIGAAILLGASSMASAALVNGSDFASASGNTHFTGLAGNPDFKWEIAPDTLSFRTKTLGGFTGVGISGRPTTDEIDIDEFLTGTSVNNLFSVFSLRLGVLFDGPEFKDVNEVAQVTATRRNGTSIVHTLTATGTTTAIWSGTTPTSGSVVNWSPADDKGGAVWEIMSPFGDIKDFTKISFTARPGNCGGVSCGNRTNQSDFTLVELKTEERGSITGTPVPEPASLALVGLGLLGMAAARRRRA